MLSRHRVRRHGVVPAPAPPPFWDWRRRIGLDAVVAVGDRPISVLDVHLSPPRRDGPTRARGRDRRSPGRPPSSPARSSSATSTTFPGGPAHAAFLAAGWIDCLAGGPRRRRVAPGSTNWTAAPASGGPPTQRLDYVLAPPGSDVRGLRRRRRPAPRSTSSPRCRTTCRWSPPSCSPAASERHAADERHDAGADAVQGPQAAGQGRGDRQRQRGRGLLGQGGRADRRPPHRPGAPAPARPAPATDRSSSRTSRSAAAPTCGPGWRCWPPSPRPTTASSSGGRDRTGPSPCSPASALTSRPRSCSTSPSTCRRRRRWRPSGRSTPAATQRWRRAFLFGFAAHVADLLAADPPGRRAPTPQADRVACCPTCRRVAPGSRQYATESFGRVVGARAPSPAVAGGWDHGHRAAGRADLGRRRVEGRRAHRPRPTGDGRATAAATADHGREAVYAAEEAAFGGTDLDRRRRPRRPRADSRPASSAGDWWARAGRRRWRSSARRADAASSSARGRRR